MIQKVSNQERMAWLENDQSFERSSMNKSALDSFTLTIVKEAKKLLASGSSLNVVAKQYNIKADFLKEIIAQVDAELQMQVEAGKSETTKIAYACDTKETEKTEYEKYLDAAQAARESLHNLRRADTEGLQNLSSKRILTNKGSYINDMGGAHKQIGSERSNTIFEPDKVEHLAKQKGNDERIKEEIAAEQRHREHMKDVSRYETINLDRLAEAIENGETRKDGGVHSMATQEHSGYRNRVPANGISIFDKKDFERVPEKTAGEKRKTELKKLANAPKDRSWVQRGAATVRTSDFLDRMIKSMVEHDPQLNTVVDKE